MKSSLPRFLIVGALCFGIDGGILFALTHWASMNPYLARVLSFIPALTAGWLLNRSWSFGHKERPTVSEFVRYGVVQGLGNGVNAVVYVACLVLVPSIPPLGALAIAALAAALFNFIGAQRFIYRP